MNTDQVIDSLLILLNLFVCSVAEDLSNLIQEQLKVLIPLQPIIFKDTFHWATR